jgi:adenylate cyclase
MEFAFAPLSISTRRKLASILLAVVIFAVLAGLATRANGRPVIFGVLNAIFVGTGVGLFDNFTYRACAADGYAAFTRCARS